MPTLLWASAGLGFKRRASRYRPIHVALVPQRHAEVGVRVDVITIQAERSTVFGDCPVYVAFLIKRDAEIVMPLLSRIGASCKRESLRCVEVFYHQKFEEN
jgi:hypothetical protein